MRERLFFGVPITDDARRAIAASLPKGLPGKPVVPENWHFTLRFLGATESDRRDQIISVLVGSSLGVSFDISFSDLGAFPNPRRARILWVGVEEGADRFRKLAKIVEDAARALGFPAEEREFTPHITLSRIDPPASVVSLVGPGIRIDPNPNSGKRSHTNSDASSAKRGQMGAQTVMRIDSIVLYRSVLGGGPPRYEQLQRFQLG